MSVWSAGYLRETMTQPNKCEDKTLLFNETASSESEADLIKYFAENITGKMPVSTIWDAMNVVLHDKCISLFSSYKEQINCIREETLK